MNDIDKKPRKLTSQEFHLIKWNLQKSRSIMEGKLDEQKESLNTSPDSLKEYYASRIKHYPFNSRLCMGVK